ncbi:uncharacterized protein EDB91DRAFT_1041503 [Suillus paluster]|uniref:uncharacterized protein n=1 Tax=Suillus paluster TaxID=48578 RepID=UPI001B869A5A|nr:uncharacterized protein EDB91DRAFT_1041503 [Suillus paluster]KAG1756882.1 hypothetical protein EDB91DRAFT_1041503 [Suillus paluster]
MWDDHTDHWKDRSIITIQGHPIAIKHWPLLYQYCHNSQWKGTKNKWSKWQAVVMRYRQGSPQEFWTEFSSMKGEQLKFTAIVDKLRGECMAADAALTQRAHEEFHAEFSDLLTYHRGGEQHVTSKPSAIVKRYRALAASR